MQSQAKIPIPMKQQIENRTNKLKIELKKLIQNRSNKLKIELKQQIENRTSKFGIAIAIGCSKNICGDTYSIISGVLSLLSLGTLIGFDIVFIINPYTCILTPTCTSRVSLTSFGFVQALSPFTNYSSYDSKRLFFYIQIACGASAFLLSLIQLLILRFLRQKKNFQLTQAAPIPQNSKAPSKPSTLKSLPPLVSVKVVPTRPTTAQQLANEVRGLSHPPLWSISNPTIFQSSYTPPF
ncbi:unnamed protein product [Rotaria magnacalcarata]|uniref:Transmembrane protein n=1 Tax=Rotaria magnacalcarata TaxID=392030 RepID=A0A8S2PI63_9BILA|nr:unnamed protein product [Rotaria magnacalcarata]